MLFGLSKKQLKMTPIALGINLPISTRFGFNLSQISLLRNGHFEMFLSRL